MKAAAPNSMPSWESLGWIWGEWAIVEHYFNERGTPKASDLSRQLLDEARSRLLLWI
jgi:hypothetical protein